MKLQIKLKQSFTILLLLLSTISIAQLPANLVNNYSFEESTNNSTTRTSCEKSFVKHRPVYWDTYEVYSCILCSPDYYSFNQDHSDFCYKCTDKNRNPFQDDRYIYIGYDPPGHEYILTELNQSLQIGKKYKFRIQAMGTPNQWFGAHLSSMGGDEWLSSQSNKMMNFFVGSIPSNYSYNDCNVRVYETIVDVDKDDLKFLAIEAQGQSHVFPRYQIDKVELYEYCPDLLIRSNREYWYESELEEANNIIAGANVNVVWPGDILMIDGSITTFKAGTEVTLVPGFNIDRGADFTAKIAQCGSDCPTTNTEFNEKYYLCANECINLGAYNIRGLTYEWTSTNPAFLNLLSSTNISSPIFCPGNAEPGTYKYIVKIRNNCGDLTEKIVYVHYYPNLNAPPAFTILNTNLNLKPTYPNIEIAPSVYTEKVTIDVLDCDGNILLSKSYFSGIDFLTTENIHWALDTYLAPCHCYKIRIRSKSFCNETIKEEILTWDRPKQPTDVNLPTLSFCKDGKRWMCISGDGIDKAEFTFFNLWGTELNKSTHTINANPYCFPIPEGNRLPDGTYFLTVKLWDCNGAEVVFDRTTIFLPSCTSLTDNADTDNTALHADGLDSLQLTVSPNPLQHINQINYHVPKNGRIKIKVLNPNFESIKTVVDSDHLSGDYVTPLSAEHLVFGINYILLELFTNDSYQKIVSKVIFQQ